MNLSRLIINNNSWSSGKGKKEGTLEVQEAKIEIVPTFLDYIKVNGLD